MNTTEKILQFTKDFDSCFDISIDFRVKSIKRYTIWHEVTKISLKNRIAIHYSKFEFDKQNYVSQDGTVTWIFNGKVAFEVTNDRVKYETQIFNPSWKDKQIEKAFIRVEKLIKKMGIRC